MATFPLTLIDNEDGTATLKSDDYKDIHIIFDQSVVEYLKDIDRSKYYFAIGNLTDGDLWQISHLGSSAGAAGSSHFLQGTIKKDGEKIICTNPTKGFAFEIIPT